MFYFLEVPITTSILILVSMLSLLFLFNMILRCRNLQTIIDELKHEQIEKESELSSSVQLLKQQKLAILNVAEDAKIAREKAADKKIKEALAFQNLMMSYIPDLIFVKDSEFKIIMANDAFLNLYPKEIRDQVIGSTTIEHYDKKEVDDFLEQDRIAFKTGFSEVEESIQFPDGSFRTLLTKKIRFNNDSKQQFILGLGRDITEMSVIRNQIKEQKDYYESLIKNLNLPAFVINKNKEVVIWNKACEQLTGIEEQEMLGTSDHWKAFYTNKRKMLSEMVLDKDFDDLENIYVSHEHHPFVKEGKRAYNWCPMPATGKELFLENDACPIYDETGSIVAVIQLLLDLTKQKEIDDLLAVNMAELKKSNKELENFAYIASHDLQEPLRTITSYTQLLEKFLAKKNIEIEEGSEYFSYIVQGAAHMHELIYGLLQYSRIGSREIRLQALEANDLFNHAVNTLSVAIDETGTVVTCDDLPTIFGDQMLLRQLFQNLIGNGIKYRDPEKLNKVHVSYQIKDDDVIFCIADNGIGIDKKYHERIFQIFKRLHTRDQYSGTGIGLSVCKKIVEQCKGDIWLESAEGEGTRFYFSLPKTERMVA